MGRSAEILRAIESLKRARLEHLTVDGVRSLVKPLLSGYAANLHVFYAPVDLYRAVRYRSVPEFLHQISYPPTAVAKLGRANREGSPVFYASMARNVSFFEQDLAPGDHIVVGRWRTNQSISVVQFGHIDDIFKSLGSAREPHLKTTGIPFKSRRVEVELARLFTEVIPREGLNKSTNHALTR